MKNETIEKIVNIKNGNGVEYILDEAFKIFNNPIVVFNMEYKLMAHTNCVSDDPIWCEFMTNGELSPKTIEFCTSESFVDDVANSTLKNGVTLLISDKLKYKRIFGQLYNKKHEAVADLVMVEQNTRFGADIEHEISALCNVLSAELALNPFFCNYGQMYREGTIRKLIKGNIEDIRTYTGHVANIDKGLKHIYVAVVDCSKAYKAQPPEYFRDLLRAAQPNYIYCEFDGKVVILISCSGRLFSASEHLRKLGEVFEYENLFAGISSRFDNLFELKKYYEQADAAAALCLTKGSNRKKCQARGIVHTGLFTRKSLRSAKSHKKNID